MDVLTTRADEQNISFHRLFNPYLHKTNCNYEHPSSSVKQWLHCKYIVKGFSYMGNHLKASGKHQALHLQTAEQRAHDCCIYGTFNFAPLATSWYPTEQTAGQTENPTVVFHS